MAVLAISTRTQPDARLEHVTPEIAREWLARNTRNRPIIRPLVARIAMDIASDAWTVNGDAIRWSTDDELLDGQHRLLGIIKADKGIDTFVIRGLPSQTQETMDAGRRRQLTDVLALRGEKNFNHLASTLGHVARIQAKDYGTYSAGLSNHAMLAILDQNPALREFAVFGGQVARSVPIPAGLAGALAHQFAQIDADDCEDFFTKLTTGSDLPADHPVLVLRNRLFENRASKQQKLPRVYVHALIVKAWNAYREGRSVAILKWSRGGRNREDFPEPV